MSDATCEACGEPNAPYAEFCIACGSYLGWQDRRPAEEAARPLDQTHRNTAPAHSLPPPETTPVATETAGEAPAAPTRETEPQCAACGTPNPTDRRFCRKCGARLSAVRAGTTPPPSQPASPRWRRFLPGNTARSRARSAYRRSLPVRYRVIRLVAGGIAVATVAGLLSVAGHSPVGWLRNNWYAVRGTLTPVPEVTAKIDPPKAVIDGYLPGFAVDNTTDQAWATTWGGGGAKGTACGPIPRGEGAALILTLPQKVTLRGLEVATGLPADDPQRVLQWRPRLLQLTYDDSSCQRVELADSDGFQRHRLRPVSTATVRVEIAAAAPPRSGADSHVAIGEIRLLCRPGCRLG